MFKTPQATPAVMRALTPERTPGKLLPLELAPRQVHALGLTYAAHINETGGEAEGPAVFTKDPASLLHEGDTVKCPSHESLLMAVERLDARLVASLSARFSSLPPLLDYEVELGLLMLEDTRAADLERPGFAPPVGYFLANDVTARSVQVLGEGRQDRMAFWCAAKSFPGFMVAGPLLWVPDTPQAAACLDVTLTLTVNGELRQQGRTMDLILSPRELLLQAARATSSGLLEKGDAVLTGTPSGVAFTVPPWKRKVGALLPAMARLSAALRTHARNPRMLKPGDVVEMDGGVLGRRRFVIG
ncbi:fumarylacetoacetate hydrolase family protein [Pyxidicoccus parkwayensis]|uniref:Fumarylacetoacetate hydrolase family protein n=1 Tax=Pyxidicoccus parkwayensis TaxID=2813578 RepID=A0ABX7P6K6_9BACT|nr:fumarylacetoacetate hydrolase family protein [Pyxidicoccus parkwaysis]QSQ26091.1 fumarylacetoacetate hydrolase family protein [Pyxidicoccus parkwaysis]